MTERELPPARGALLLRGVTMGAAPAAPPTGPTIDSAHIVEAASQAIDKWGA